MYNDVYYDLPSFSICFPYVFHMFPPKKPADLPGKPRPAPPPPPVPPVPARPRPAERMSRLSPRKKKDGTGRKGKDARILQMLFLFKVLLFGNIKGISRNLYLFFCCFFVYILYWESIRGFVGNLTLYSFCRSFFDFPNGKSARTWESAKPRMAKTAWPCDVCKKMPIWMLLAICCKTQRNVSLMWLS